MLKPHGEEIDLKLLDVAQDPLFQVVDFLESRKLGPGAGRDLLNALGGYSLLTKSQEELLVKVCQRLGHEDWSEAILQEMASTIQALEACDAECSHSALNMI